MAVRRHVDRHAVDACREVGAVVEVEAAQEVLVGLAVARVLRDDHAGRRFQEFAGPGVGLLDDALGRAVLLAGGIFRFGLTGLCRDIDDLRQHDGRLRLCGEGEAREDRAAQQQ